MKYIEELKNAIIDEDFYQTNEIIEKIKKENDAFEYVQLILEFMEENPEIDYGMPGPIVHFVETYYKKGYEELLLNSVEKIPTIHTLWMLNRVINDSNLIDKEKYIMTLVQAYKREDISQIVRNEIERFLKYQQRL